MSAIKCFMDHGGTILLEAPGERDDEFACRGTFLPRDFE